MTKYPKSDRLTGRGEGGQKLFGHALIDRALFKKRFPKYVTLTFFARFSFLFFSLMISRMVNVVSVASPPP